MFLSSKPSKVIDLRNSPRQVLKCEKGYRYIVGQEHDPHYIDRFRYYNIRSLIQPFENIITTITINQIYALIGVIAEPITSNALRACVIYARTNADFNAVKPYGVYTIMYLIPCVIEANIGTELYLDRDKRTICVAGSNSVIERLPSI